MSKTHNTDSKTAKLAYDVIWEIARFHDPRQNWSGQEMTAHESAIRREARTRNGWTSKEINIVSKVWIMEIFVQYSARTKQDVYSLAVWSPAFQQLAFSCSRVAHDIERAKATIKRNKDSDNPYDQRRVKEAKELIARHRKLVRRVKATIKACYIER